MGTGRAAADRTAGAIQLLTVEASRFSRKPSGSFELQLSRAHTLLPSVRLGMSIGLRRSSVVDRAASAWPDAGRLS
jgi:hypothetical protein